MSLLDQLDKLRSQVRRLLWLTGVAWIVGCFVSGMLIVGLLDWLWHWDDRGLRVFCWVGWLGLVSGVFWKRLAVPLRWPLSAVELSAVLERRFPTLRGQLATAVEFLEQGVSPRVGSIELQRRVIERTAATMARIDLTSVLDRREANRSLLAAVVVSVLALAILGVDAASASIAFQRALWPFGDQRWPQRVELQLVRGDGQRVEESGSEPLRFLHGQPLDLFVVNARGTMPQPTWIEFRRIGEPSRSEKLPPTTLRGEQGQAREAVAVRLPTDRGAMEFRVIGGDDRSMTWRQMDFVPPPTIAALQLTVIPPKYTSDPDLVLPNGTQQVRVLLGSRLRARITPSQAVSQVSWCDPARDQPLVAKLVSAENGRDLAIYQIDVELTNVMTSIHRVALRDANGFEAATAGRMEVQVVADPPPTVAFVEPTSDQTVTLGATLSIRAVARDDRELNELFIESSIDSATDADTSASSPQSTADLDRWTRIAVVTVPNRPGSESSVSRNNTQLQTELNLAMQMVNEHPIAVGDTLVLRAAASDRCNVGEPRLGRSAARRFTIVSHESKSHEIARRLELLLHELESLAVRESQTREQTLALRTQLDKAGTLRPDDRDTLKRVELDQRQIDARLIGPNNTVAVRAQQLLAELHVNRLDDDPSHVRLTAIETAISRLERNVIPSLEASLAELVKSQSVNAAMPHQESLSTLAGIASAQLILQSALELLIQDLSQWRDRRELAREVSELSDLQGELNREVTDLTPHTLGKPAAELPAQQQADLAKLADRQARQAERLDQLRQRLRNQESRDSNNGGSHQRELADELERRTLAEKARAASQEIADNNLGQAARMQQAMTAELKELANQLSQPVQSQPAAEAAQELKQIESQLKSLTDQQRTLLDETQAVDSKRSSLKETELAEQTLALQTRQSETRKTAERLAEHAEKTSATESSAALRRAARHMQQAARELADSQVAHATEQQQRALEQLQESQKKTSELRQSAEQQNADEQNNELLKLLKGLVEQQRTAITNTEQLREEQQKAGTWTRPLAKTVLKLSDTEHGLAKVTRELAQHASELESLQKPLELVTDNLELAGSRLRDKQLDEATRNSQATALKTLEQLVTDIEAQPTAPSSARSKTATDDNLPPDQSATASNDGNGGKPTGKENSQPQNSSDRTDTGTNQAAQLLKQQRLREAVWGHLPPALRDKMLNLPHDKSLPKYSEQIRRYYEALADQ